MPALWLKIAAALGAVSQIVWIAMLVMGISIAGAEGGEDAVGAVLGGVVYFALGVIGLGIAVFLWIGASRMAALQGYNLSMAAAIVALVPCLSPCCVLTLPFGIWALVVLAKPEVKAAFAGRTPADGF
jgi:hypothetical protein